MLLKKIIVIREINSQGFKINNHFDKFESRSISSYSAGYTPRPKIFKYFLDPQEHENLKECKLAAFFKKGSKESNFSLSMSLV